VRTPQIEPTAAHQKKIRKIQEEGEGCIIRDGTKKRSSNAVEKTVAPIVAEYSIKTTHTGKKEETKKVLFWEG